MIKRNYKVALGKGNYFRLGEKYVEEDATENHFNICPDSSIKCKSDEKFYDTRDKFL